MVCCAHAELVEAHIKASKWMHQRTCKMHLVVATACLSLGDALRELDVKGVISGDFVLVTGDVVTNMDLGAAMARHRARKAADADAIMTLVGALGSARIPATSCHSSIPSKPQDSTCPPGVQHACGR